MKELKKNNSISIAVLWSKLKKKFDDFDISQSHLHDVIRDNNITRKRTKRRHYPETRYGKPIDLEKQLKEFYKDVSKFSLKKIISLDETSVYAQMPSNYSRCELGKRCVVKTKDNKVFVKYTLVCAISSKGIVGYELYKEGGMNCERMIQFLDKFIYGKYKKHVIIMDNGGSHKNKLIKEKISQIDNYLLYSVPYKPKTNAIESWFSQFKHYFTGEIDSKVKYEDVLKNVKKAMKKIPKVSYLNYMKYAYSKKKRIGNLEKESSRRRKVKDYKK